MRRRPNAKRREAARRAELRRLRAAAREPREVETVYVRTYVRRPRWQRINTAVWLVILGIFIGGGVIPHVEDRPYLDAEPEAEATGAGQPPKPPGGVLTAPAPEESWQPMSYSWAPYKGATGYQIAFYRDGKRLAMYETTEPSYSIALAPGTYQWIVWPIVNGRYTSKAIVNSVITT